MSGFLTSDWSLYSIEKETRLMLQLLVRLESGDVESDEDKAMPLRHLRDQKDNLTLEIHVRPFNI